MDMHKNIDTICEQILLDARQQAEEILNKARQHCQQEMVAAQTDVARMKERLSQEAMRNEEQQKRKVLCSVGIEIKKAHLQAQEALIQDVIAEVYILQHMLRINAAYALVLQTLAEEGICALDKDEVNLVIAPQDKGVLTESWMSALKERVAKKMTCGSVKMRVVSDAAIQDIGLRVQTNDNRIIFDNTLSARIERQKEAIRYSIVMMLQRKKACV